jgi:AbrB family looped-hinge helix DNA binding protein
MSRVTVSPKFQIVIPKEIRKSMGIHPGERFEVLLHKDRIEYIPLKSLKKMRGILSGMNTQIDRDGDRI